LPGSHDFIGLLSDADSLQLMLFACPDAVVATDRDDRVVLYTGASESMFGFAPIEVLHQPVRRLFATAEGYEHFRRQLVAEQHIVNLEVPAVRKDHPHFVGAFSAALLHDRFGEEMGTILYVRDHSKMRSIEEALRDNNHRLNELVRTLNHVAQHDQLTGMLHRGSAIETAEASLFGRNAPESFGVALFDLDHFKGINDTYGHLVGDEVLASLAGVLKQTARQDDIIGRFGGEEFIAFLPGADLAKVTGFAERVRQAIGQARVHVDGEAETGIAVTISAGVASMPACAETLQDAIRVADDRLLEAKRAGRNRVVSTGSLFDERTAA